MTSTEPTTPIVVTSWRLPLEGEDIDKSWSSRYYKNEPCRFRVIETGPSLDKVRVMAE
jgi:hypothetical protein